MSNRTRGILVTVVLLMYTVVWSLILLGFSSTLVSTSIFATVFIMAMLYFMLPKLDKENYNTGNKN